MKFEEWLTQPEGLATRLRLLRAQAGLSGKALADRHSWAQSKVSRIEGGKQLPSVEDIRAWSDTCGADEDTVSELLRLHEGAGVARAKFSDRMARGQANVQEDYNGLVAASSVIGHFETVYVPGLLQVPGYIRSVLTEMVSLHSLDIDDVDAAVDARMRRQQMLYNPGKSFEFLLCEPVLRWLVCPREVMREQLDRLQTVIGLARVRFGIIPMGVELATTPQNSFQVYAAKETVVIAETFAGEEYYGARWGRADEAAAYERAMARLWDDAVTGDAARQLIISATQALPTA